MSNFNEKREFENFICNMHKYKYLFDFLKGKIGHDCARKIVIQHYYSLPGGAPSSFNEYAMEKTRLEFKRRRSHLVANKRIERGTAIRNFLQLNRYKFAFLENKNHTYI